MDIKGKGVVTKGGIGRGGKKSLIANRKRKGEGKKRLSCKQGREK